MYLGGINTFVLNLAMKSTSTVLIVGGSMIVKKLYLYVYVCHGFLFRCTATPLRPTKVNGPVRFLVAAHTATPWVFPHFYPKPWLLEFVNETHVRYCVELRQVSN